MGTVSLTNSDRLAVVDDEDLYRLAEFGLMWSLHTNGHIISTKSPRIYLHEFLFGKSPRPRVWDHENRNGLDNQRHNLRVATRRQNSQNRGRLKNNTSGYIGVSRAGKKWVARISLGGHTIHLRRWDLPEEAAHVRDHVASRIYGEFAVLNFQREP